MGKVKKDVVMMKTKQRAVIAVAVIVLLAAAVLGGTRLSGGVGTVKGSLLGVLLMMIVSNNLILLGIPTYWSKFVTGVFIILGIGISSYQALRAQRVLSASVLENAPDEKDAKEAVRK